MNIFENYPNEETDGIDLAKQIIRDAGGQVTKLGFIYLPPDHNMTQAVADAANFLVSEWDYMI